MSNGSAQIIRLDPNRPTPHRRVDFFNEVDDHTCVLLASLGFSTRYICERTDLSPSQVTYRLQKAGLTQDNKASRMDFRNGVSPMAKVVLGQVRQAADEQLIKHLKKYV
jgi:hypothetical protein